MSGGRVTDMQDRASVARTWPSRSRPTAGVASLSELRGYQRRLGGANEPVEDAVRVIRGQLGLPPPDTS